RVDRGAISRTGEISGSSSVTFAPGLTAYYAIAISSKSFVGSNLFKINPDGSLTFVKDMSLSGGGDALRQQREINLTLADIGITPASAFNFDVTYFNATTAAPF